MYQPFKVIRQNVSSVESSAVVVACMLQDIPYQICDIKDLGSHEVSRDLRAGAMPVGTVEFVREAMRVAGIIEPVNLSYPVGLGDLTCREVQMTSASELGLIDKPVFIKPFKTKTFTGFVFNPSFAAEDYDEHDREQFLALQEARKDPTTVFWLSEVVDFAGEWRYYVLDGEILGSARYDPDGADDVPEPEAGWVRSSAATVFAQTKNRSFSIDVGRLSDGRHALVECNDAFAIGLYGKALVPKDYLAFLWARWSQLKPMPSLGAEESADQLARLKSKLTP